jgi:hypothetical protein
MDGQKLREYLQRIAERRKGNIFSKIGQNGEWHGNSMSSYGPFLNH